MESFPFVHFPLDGHFQLEGGEDGCGLAWQFFQDKFPGSDARGGDENIPQRPTCLGDPLLPVFFCSKTINLPI